MFPIHCDRFACPRFESSLQPYVDGETSPDVTRVVSEHLRVCQDCGRVAESYRSIKAALAQRAQVDDGPIQRLADFTRRLTFEADPPPG